MTTTALLQEAASYQEQLVRTRRFLHTHPGTGFDIQETVDYVKQELISMGYEPQMCGKSGIVALAGQKKDGKVFLIRGDMDALPMKEEDRGNHRFTLGQYGIGENARLRS